jgi:hypothetical protein
VGTSLVICQPIYTQKHARAHKIGDPLLRLATMADIILRFAYTGTSSDIRTFKVYQVFEGMSGELELYRVSVPLQSSSLRSNNSCRLCLVLTSDDRSSERHDNISSEESEYVICSAGITNRK